MRILYVVPYAPNLIRVRPYNFIRQLSQRGHQVTVAALWSEAWEREGLEEFEAYCEQLIAVRVSKLRSGWNCLRALPTSTPLQAVYSWQPSFAERLKQLVARNESPPFDVLHIEHLRGASYGLALKAVLQGSPRPIPVVWDSVDCISHLFRQAATRSRRPASRWLTRLELSRTQKFEAQLLNQFERVLVTSSLDRQAFLDLPQAAANGSGPMVVANGVDLSYFSPGDPSERKPGAIVLSGKMSYHANVSMALHFANDIFPAVLEAEPEAKLWIVGKNPSASVRALGRSPSIVVTGEVEDLRPYLRQASVAVAPVTYGAGIQNKVLEAMACATPVVATSAAARALEADPGQELILADEPLAFAANVVSLLRDPKRRRSIGDAGRAYAERTHSWGKMTARLENIYDELIAN